MKKKPKELSPHQRSLLRAAAAAGPGHLGRRERLGPDEARAVAEALSAEGLGPPPYLGHEKAWTDRRAKLFEAGDYPDKGVTVTREHLAGLAERFDLPVPILIEHAKSPLELGYLTKVAADGDDLVGTVALTAEADALIRQSGAQSLSLGLSPDLMEIREVSLVRNPRVASARLFGHDVAFTAPWHEEDDWKARFAELARERSRERARLAVTGHLRAGRLVPAQSAFAEALLAVESDIQFDGVTVPVARLVERLIESARPHQLFSETPRVPAGETAALPPDEQAFYERHFPGLDLGAIARNRRADLN
ncbi:MAG: hypothetical protein KF857_00945 [Fimbriimonadaceae bacterium]|nr:hypothetical protein [Fimbriimonadaceae bacterium]